jgi:hypothetical protein
MQQQPGTRYVGRQGAAQRVPHSPWRQACPHPSTSDTGLCPVQSRVCIYDRNGKLYEELHLPPPEVQPTDTKLCCCTQLEVRGAATNICTDSGKEDRHMPSLHTYWRHTQAAVMDISTIGCQGKHCTAWTSLPTDLQLTVFCALATAVGCLRGHAGRAASRQQRPAGVDSSHPGTAEDGDTVQGELREQKMLVQGLQPVVAPAVLACTALQQLARR